MLFYCEAAEELTKLKVDFIKTDLNVAFTFVQIARRANEGEKGNPKSTQCSQSL